MRTDGRRTGKAPPTATPKPLKLPDTVSYDIDQYSSTMCKPWCLGDVKIDRAAAEARGRKTLSEDGLAD